MSPERRRLHPAAIAVYALAALREAAVPLVILFVIRGFDSGALSRGLLYAAGGTAFAAVMGFLRWRTTRWWVTEEGIHHRRGLPLYGNRQAAGPLRRPGLQRGSDPAIPRSGRSPLLAPGAGVSPSSPRPG